VENAPGLLNGDAPAPEQWDKLTGISQAVFSVWIAFHQLQKNNNNSNRNNIQ